MKKINMKTLKLDFINARSYIIGLQKKAETWMKNSTLPRVIHTLGHTSISDHVSELHCVSASFITEHTVTHSHFQWQKK